MKIPTPLVLPLLLAASLPATAANLMLDFGATAVASPYLTLSPGHSVAAIPGTQTSWNTVSTTANRTDLLNSDGTTATGITLDLGQEATGGDNIINFGTAITSLALAGSGGGVPGQQSLLGTGAIYGDNTGSTAAGRDAFFGSGGSTLTAQTAIGLRIDGLEAGDYKVFVMARNTNSNAAAYPMNLFTTTGSSATNFNFSALTAASQSNAGYAAIGYSGQYNTFVNGENYRVIDFTITTGNSFFLAVDGGDSTLDNRGFLNMVQIVSVPEPSAALLGSLGLLFLFRRRK